MNKQQYKGLKKESLRDNMDSIELILSDLGEEATIKYRYNELNENMIETREGRMVARVVKQNLESKLNEKIVTKNNKIGIILVEED